MTFFESLLTLLAVAILLLQVSRRLAIPYPTMLAAAGVGLALVPGAPRITLELLLIGLAGGAVILVPSLRYLLSNFARKVDG